MTSKDLTSCLINLPPGWWPCSQTSFQSWSKSFHFIITPPGLISDRHETSTYLTRAIRIHPVFPDWSLWHIQSWRLPDFVGREIHTRRVSAIPWGMTDSYYAPIWQTGAAWCNAADSQSWGLVGRFLFVRVCSWSCTIFVLRDDARVREASVSLQRLRSKLQQF